jgi:uncharacterized membrane protein
MYANNTYHGKKIIRLENTGKPDEVKCIAKITYPRLFIALGRGIVFAILAFILLLSYNDYASKMIFNGDYF